MSRYAAPFSGNALRRKTQAGKRVSPEFTPLGPSFVKPVRHRIVAGGTKRSARNCRRFIVPIPWEKSPNAHSSSRTRRSFATALPDCKEPGVSVLRSNNFRRSATVEGINGYCRHSLSTAVGVMDRHSCEIKAERQVSANHRQRDNRLADLCRRNDAAADEQPNVELAGFRIHGTLTLYQCGAWFPQCRKHSIRLTPSLVTAERPARLDFGIDAREAAAQSPAPPFGNALPAGGPASMHGINNQFHGIGLSA